MSDVRKYVVEEDQGGKRLDLFLSEVCEISRSQAQKAVKQGLININGAVVNKSSKSLKVDEKVEVSESPKDEKNEEDEGSELVESLPIEINIIDETDSYLVIDKPTGLLVHPTQANEPTSVVSWLVEKYPEVKNVGDSPERLGIVHRLDKNASGVLVIAKTQKMFDHLKKQFQARTVEKGYIVLVHGAIKRDHSEIDFAIDRGVDGKMVSRPKTDPLSLKTVDKIQPGKEALTEFWVEQRFINYTLLKVKIHTGRTHQIRVHMLAYGHPVVGDQLYFNRKIVVDRDKKLGRFFLHAKRLCFEDLGGEKVCFETELPERLNSFLSNIV